MTLDAQNALQPPPGIPGRATGNTLDLLGRLPWWAIVIVVLGLGLGLGMLTGAQYRSAFVFVQSGIVVTLVLSITSYATALVLGLIAGLGRVSKNVIFYTISTLYVEIVRGIPLLVQIIVISYLIVPWLINDVINGYFFGELHWLPQRVNGSPWVTSTCDRGAGRRLRRLPGRDLSRRHRVDLQRPDGSRAQPGHELRAGHALRGPAAGLPHHPATAERDFIAMLKDSSWSRSSAVQDLTFRGRLKISNSFDTFTVWYVVSYVYLLMTLSLSALVRLIERRTSTPR
jgi:polar amino acid transport system permease protein